MRRSVEFVLADGIRSFGVCLNLSLGGMRIEAAELGAFGARVTVYMKLEEIEGETALAGVVRWTKPGVMGIQFDLHGARITYALLRTLTDPHGTL
jgi:hypothetical protein